MHQNKADYTNTFCYLMNEKIQNNEIFNNENFFVWKKRWEERLMLNNNTPEKYLKLMRSVNPIIIPRNHKVEEALEFANNNDLSLVKKLIKILEKPYENQKGISEYQYTAPASDQKYQTFCGTELKIIVRKVQVLHYFLRLFQLKNHLYQLFGKSLL